MNKFTPSGTALMAAAARAAHLVVDNDPRIFSDTLAAALLGDRAQELIAYHLGHAGHPILSAARAQVTCRSRYAEDCLAGAVAAGVRQYVLLGAGLDSFACRSELASQVRVFEVDHPDTQHWKRSALEAAGLGPPSWLRFIPADLAAGSLADALAEGGFEFSAPAVISCLGVIMYLPLAGIGGVLDFAAGCAPGTQLIADYMLPAALRDAAGNQYVELVAPSAAEGGEPWQAFLSPADVAGLLAKSGIAMAEHVHQRELLPASLWQRTDTLRPIELSMLVRAKVT
jgi:methyltransferase (TIGR00027 family)